MFEVALDVKSVACPRAKELMCPPLAFIKTTMFHRWLAHHRLGGTRSYRRRMSPLPLIKLLFLQAEMIDLQIL
jgi:hypothetical protein